MKKASKIKCDFAIRKEYDFSRGVRGKYYKRFKEGSNIAVIDAELAEIHGPVPMAIFDIITNVIDDDVKVAIDRRDVVSSGAVVDQRQTQGHRAVRDAYGPWLLRVNTLEMSDKRARDALAAPVAYLNRTQRRHRLKGHDGDGQARYRKG